LSARTYADAGPVEANPAPSPYPGCVQEPDRLQAPDPTRGIVRLLRAVAVGTSAVVVSLVGHASGGASPPSLLTTGLLVAVASAVAWRLSLARWTVTSLTGVLVVAQSGLHLSFTMDAGVAAHHQTVPMLLGHAAATLIMVVVLSRGESLLWAVVESLSLRVWRLLRPATLPPRPTVPRPVGRRSLAMPRCWHGFQPPRRGPPRPSRTPILPA
jgi:hypothetical protein